jgi:hypothetical protein
MLADQARNAADPNSAIMVLIANAFFFSFCERRDAVLKDDNFTVVLSAFGICSLPFICTRDYACDCVLLLRCIETLEFSF